MLTSHGMALNKGLAHVVHIATILDVIRVGVGANPC